MAGGDIAGYVGGAVAAVATYLTYRTNLRAAASTDRKVTMEEHRDSMARLQAIINEQDKFSDRLRTQIDRMYAQLDSLQDQLSRERDVSQLLRTQVTSLQDQVRTLQHMVNVDTPRRAAARLADSELPEVTD